MSEIVERKLNVPELRFPEFGGEWEVNKLVSLFSIKNGYAFSSLDAQNCGTRWVKIADVGFNQMKTGKPSFLPPDFLVKYKNYILKTGDYVVALTRPILNGRLKISQIDSSFDNSLLNQRVGKLISNNNLGFISLILQLPWLVSKIETHIDGSDPPNLAPSSIKSISLQVPTLPEQQKIASFLSAVDEKIAQLQEKKSLLEDYKKGCMQKLFSQTLRFKDDDGNDYPDWEEKRLGDIFDEVQEKVGNQLLPTYSISAGAGWVSQVEKFGRDISGQQHVKYTALNEGEFSYNKGNSKSYKFGCVYPNNTGKKIAVPNVFISFKKIHKSISVGFYAKLFENHYLDRGLRTLISSGARMDGLLNVNKGDFFKLKIPHPHPDEQQKIADFLSAIDAKITHATTQLEQTKTFKKGLLQKMFV